MDHNDVLRVIVEEAISASVDEFDSTDAIMEEARYRLSHGETEQDVAQFTARALDALERGERVLPYEDLSDLAEIGYRIDKGW